jgi:hypothetical protein
MTIAVFTACTNRKRVPAVNDLTGRHLPKGNLETIVEAWIARLEAQSTALRVGDLYVGRGYQEARTAALSMQASHFIVSAGIGVVSTNDVSPSYSLTVVRGQADSVLDRIEPVADAPAWWSTLRNRTRNASQHDWSKFSSLVFALPREYLRMADSLFAELPDPTKVRIIARTNSETLNPKYTASTIRYDARLDGNGSPFAGTLSDFASRALRHFAEHVYATAPDASITQHQAMVDSLLAQYSVREIPERQKLTDPEIQQLILQHWDTVDGRSGKMLRHLRRELGIACEQGRFKNLFNEVADTRAHP